MSEYIDPQIRDSFRPVMVRLSPHQTVAAFVSKSGGGFISCPPYVIATVAEQRVAPGADLNLPEGYDQETLQRIRNITGWVGQEVDISGRQSEELSQMGAQILALDELGKIEPPLGHYEKQSITHLMTLVGQTAIS